MKRIRIEGGHKLQGTIRISGAKNSAVALVPASLLSDEVVVAKDSLIHLIPLPQHPEFWN